MGNVLKIQIGKGLTDKKRNRVSDIPDTPSPNKTKSVTDKPDRREIKSMDVKQVKALYDYTAPPDSPDDLSFMKGDIMNILDDSDRDWWVACNNRTKMIGNIPNNYVTLLRGIESFDWFHPNITKNDSDKLLAENVNNVIGTYLVRKSESVQGAYTLSVLYLDDDGRRAAKNYRIRTMENNCGYYISSKDIFPTMQDLIKFYASNDGLCERLTKACPKMSPVVNDLSKATRDKWEIDRKTLDKIEILGSGNFGEVWRGLWNSTRPVAIKMMKPGTMETSKFLEEAAVMKELRHPKLVRLYAVCTAEEPIYIVMEYIAKGCLQKYLKNDGGKKLITPVLIDFAAQIASGMQYIESKNIIHRDLATRNVLVGDNNMLKIADFGLSKSVKEDAVYFVKEDAKFPIKWTAIEAITSQSFSIKSDVWSFGILLVELVTFGSMPYPGVTAAEVQVKLQGSYRHPKPRGCSDELYEIMLSCWHKDPERRPTFDTLFHILDDFLIATENSYDGGR